MAYAPESLGYYYCPKFVRPSPFLEHDDFRAEASRRMQRPLSAGESSRFWFREALSLAVRHPLRTMELVARKTAILFNDFEVPDSEDYSVSAEFVPLLRVLPSFGWLVGFGAIGIVLSLRWSMTSHATNRCWLPLGFVAAHALFVVVVYNFGRFRLGMMPVWMLFAAQGLSWLIMATRSVSQTTRWQAACGWVVALALSGVALIPPPGYVQAEATAATRTRPTRCHRIARRTGSAIRQRGRTSSDRSSVVTARLEERSDSAFRANDHTPTR
jgi:hypothetical protein